MEAIVAMLILVIIVENEYVRTYEDFGKRTYTWQEIMLKLSANSVTGLVIKLIFFYFLLHSWHNFFAEILTFSDRLFYKVRYPVSGLIEISHLVNACIESKQML